MNNDSDATEPIQDAAAGAEESVDAIPAGRESTPDAERHGELADLIANAEAQTRSADEKSAEQAAAEQSGSYVYPDGGAASSQRMRPIPPNGKKISWWVRYRRELTAAELFLTGLFFLLTLYFLFLWITGRPALACVPDKSWTVAAEPGRWRYIVVHHTATERSSPASIDRYHREVRKWEGLGYHFLIGNGKTNGRDPTLGDGEVHVGVRWQEQRGGAHVRMKEVKNANAFSIGIALIGNFEKDPPTPRQVAALCCLVRFLAAEYGIPKNQIVGHGDVSERHTLCPGKLLPMKEVLSSL